MPQSYAEIEVHIEQALHKLHAREKSNIAAVTGISSSRDMTSCAFGRTDINRHRTGWTARIYKESKIYVYTLLR